MMVIITAGKYQLNRIVSSINVKLIRMVAEMV